MSEQTYSLHPGVICRDPEVFREPIVCAVQHRLACPRFEIGPYPGTDAVRKSADAMCEGYGCFVLYTGERR